jgi:Spy/CpxP family protein refolding chaperone
MFIVIALMAGNAGAQPGWVNPWAQTLNAWGLTAEQMKQIQDTRLQWQTEMTPLWSELQAKSIAFQSLRWQPNPDTAAVETLTKEIGEIQARIQAKSLELRNAVRGLLTEAQQVLFDQQGLGAAGWGGGMGMGLGWSGGFGRGRGFRGGRGRGWSMGAAPGAYGGAFYGGGGSGWPMGAPGGAYGGAFYGRGRGPCGMGMAGYPMSPWMGRWPW